MESPENSAKYQDAIDQAKAHADPAVREKVLAIIGEKEKAHDERLARMTPGPSLTTETYHALLHAGLIEAVS